MEERSDACEVEKSGNRDAVIVIGERKDWGQCRTLPLPGKVGRGGVQQPGAHSGSGS